MKYDPRKHHRPFDKPQGRRSIRLKGYDYTRPGAYFVTLVTHQQEPLFGEILNGGVKLNEVGAIVAASWRNIPAHFHATQLDEFIVMSNHLHGILCTGEASAVEVVSDKAYRAVWTHPAPVQAHSADASPQPPRGTRPGSLNAIIQNFKSILSDKQAGGDLYKHLRCQKKRRKRYGSLDRQGKLPNRRSIEERPKIVDQRQRIGDGEVDTLVGKRHHQAIVTLTERKSRLALLRKINHRTVELVRDAVIDLPHPVANRTHTITGDNGKEFAEHERIAQDLAVDFFFAHPYAAWERGANENMNGLIHQYILKNRDLTSVTENELEQIMNKLNHRPRKCLDFLSPFEVFFEHAVALTS